MPKSQFVEGLDVIQAEVNLLLKPLGFQKTGRTHNRFTKGGLTHVVNFQKEKCVEKRIMFPRIWKKSYGEFAINLGVLSPCVYQAEWQSSPAEFVEEYNCTIRQRLGQVAGWDKWFAITDDISGLAKTVVGLFQQRGLNFLEQFQTYEDMLSYYRKHGNLPRKNSYRSSLEVALIFHHIGDVALAQSLFQKAYAAKHEGFRKYVAQLANKLGYSIG